MPPAHKVLIVEDERPLRQALLNKFRLAGFAVDSANDGESGLAKALADRPDVILLDIVMPRMDGLTMLAKLRQDAWGLTARVIIMTNRDDYENVNTAMKHRVADILVKSSWSLEEIVAKVKKLLSS